MVCTGMLKLRGVRGILLLLVHIMLDEIFDLSKSCHCGHSHMRVL